MEGDVDIMDAFGGKENAFGPTPYHLLHVSLGDLKSCVRLMPAMSQKTTNCYDVSY